MNAAAPRTLFILVDGLGLGAADPGQNPLYGGACPRLRELLETRAVPIDAAMGVPGIPQSATGQAALLTGVNAARHMGRHVEGFPGPALRDLIRANNLYDKLALLGFSSTFANAYYVTDVAEVEARRIQSVTTVSALKAFGRVRDLGALVARRAVYQDLTRESLRPRGYEGPLVSPSDSASDLLAIAREHDLTLFEYFQTDRVGHKGTRAEKEEVLALFDEFLAGLLGFPDENPANLLILTSDHGNIEAEHTRMHTENPVPLVAIGQGASELRERVKSVTDVTPALVALYERAARPSEPVKKVYRAFTEYARRPIG